MTLLLAASTSYRIGEITALVVLAVLFVALVLRAIGMFPRTTVPALVPSPILPPAMGPAASTAPPGFAPTSVQPTPVAGAGLHHSRSSRARRTDALGALIVAALLVAGVIHVIGHSTHSDPWATPAGVSVKAGFLGGCQNSAGNLVDCECAFARITSHSAYDTPAGFAMLIGPAATFEQTKSLQVLPSVFVSAVRSCTRPSQYR